MNNLQKASPLNFSSLKLNTFIVLMEFYIFIYNCDLLKLKKIYTFHYIYHLLRYKLPRNLTHKYYNSINSAENKKTRQLLKKYKRKIFN